MGGGWLGHETKLGIAEKSIPRVIGDGRCATGEAYRLWHGCHRGCDFRFFRLAGTPLGAWL